MYTVKRLSDLAGVTVRTLHYYDQIDLLKPTQVSANGYRHYDDSALYRLQQILFYREIGLELLEIREILDSPDFDLVTALKSHREVLQTKIKRLNNLINTVDMTVKHLTGEVDMSRKKMFNAFSDEEQKQYEREARLQYGPDMVNDSVRRWNSYSDLQRQVIADEGNQIYEELVTQLEAGVSAKSAAVQAILERWHQHLRYFYEPTLDILRGLGMMYSTSPDFIANFQKLHSDLPEYLTEGIEQYVDDLEYAEIERLLAADEEQSGQR